MSNIFRKYWLVILGLPLLLVSAWLALTRPTSANEWDDIIQAIVVTMGWVLFILQYLYSKSEKFYILVNSIRLWFTNETTKWNFVVDYYDCTEKEPLNNIWAIVSSQIPDAKRWHQDPSTLIINMPGYTLRAFTSIDPTQYIDVSTLQTVSIQLSDLELPFRTFRAKIENEAIPMIQVIAETLKPTRGKYVAKIAFSSTNPYFGFFVRRLDLPSVVSFTCDLIENGMGKQDQVVTIRKDRIEIVADNLVALQTLSSRYVRLTSD